MYGLEQFIIGLLLRFTSQEAINSALGDPRTTAILIGGLVAASGGLLGVFLKLRHLSLVTDAISHTILLGIVVAFIVMSGLFGLAPDISSPILILGAALAGVGTVILTELIQRSGLIKGDTALGLVFPLLFAIAVLLVTRFTSNIHLDTDAVVVGEIGVAWANTHSHCYAGCDDVVITPDHPAARVERVCTNCTPGGINPRSPDAVFAEQCANCGTYSAAEAWAQGLTDTQPELVLWPRSLTTMGVITFLNLAFVLIFYKELKLASFDAALARALGFRPGWLHYALMILVSITAVGAFDAVGAVLVIAFFIIPPATAYLLTHRLGWMLVLSPVFGAASALVGYDLARANLLGLIPIQQIIPGLTWNTSISASMVIAQFCFFLLAWALSPQQGFIAGMLRRARQRRQFEDQVVMGHILHHHETADAQTELAMATLHQHFYWTPSQMRAVLGRLTRADLIEIMQGRVGLTPEGEAAASRFERELRNPA
jgi:manganese/zinc/iron transport system permease protein